MAMMMCLSSLAKPINIVHIYLKKNDNALTLTFDAIGPIQYDLKSLPEHKLSLIIHDANLRAPFPKINSDWVRSYQKNKQAEDMVFDFAMARDFKSNASVINAAEKSHLILELTAKASVEKKSPPKKEVVAEMLSKAEPTDVIASFAEPKITATAIKEIEKPVSIKKPNGHRLVVVIDPGHGGHDSGAKGQKGYQEKNVVLAISRVLQQTLRAHGYEAVLTRNGDYFIPLRQRLAIARRYKPDLFLAVHADAAFNNEAVGASVFALSERGATSEGARWLAVKENESELMAGVYVEKDPLLRSVLLDLSQTHTISVSLEMGQCILQQLSQISRLHYKRVEQAAFVVLKSPDIPSLLVETGYITNAKQELQLNNPDYQRQLAENIVRGINEYFRAHPQG